MFKKIKNTVLDNIQITIKLVPMPMEEGVMLHSMAPHSFFNILYSELLTILILKFF